MNRPRLIATSLVCLLIGVSTARTAEEMPDLLHTSPSGAFRVELGDDGNVWVVSSKSPAARAKLPKQSPDSPTDDEFHFSPSEEWIFGLRHVGSGLRDGSLYHRISSSRIENLDKRASFNELAWENCVKLGALREDYSAEGFYAMTFFVAWSLDSRRLLIQLSGGEEKRAMHDGYLYLNTQTGKFEMTDYVRRLNKAKSAMLACAEPGGPLPSEAELKARFDKLDQQLNKTYGIVIAQTVKDRAPVVREAQRAWVKHRDEGSRFYISVFPEAEKERRRLQFLGDVTAARIETPPERWEL